MENKPPAHQTPVANPGPSGVFLFPNASTVNVPAFPPFPVRPGRSTIVGHVFPFPLSRPAVLAGFRPRPGRPTLARKSQDQKTGVDPFPAVGRSDPFPAVLRRPTIHSGRSPSPGRSTAVLTVLPPFLRSTPTVGHGSTPADDGRRSRTTAGNPGRTGPTTPDDGRRRPRRRSDGRTTTTTPDGRRPARNGNGGLRI